MSAATSASPSQSPSPTQIYLDFNGHCEAAIEFYRQHLGADQIEMMRFGDNPEAGADCPQPGDKIMHGSFRIGGTQILASDCECGGSTNFAGFNLTYPAADADEARRVFGALADGGKETMALQPTFFAQLFGEVRDRFGVSWMVGVFHPCATDDAQA